MAYDEATKKKYTQVGHLEELIRDAETNYAKKKDFEALSSKVDSLVSTGGEPNVIDEIQVNGSKVDPVGKMVNITIPKNTSELTNNSDFQTSTQVLQAIQTEIAATGHASFEVAESIPDYSTAKENVLYLVLNSETQCYDIYAKIKGSSKMERLDDVSIDLSKYSTTDQMNEELAKKANTEHDHVVSDITDLQTTLGNYTLKSELTSGLAGKADKEHDHDEASETAPGFMSVADKKKLDGIETATDEDIQAMIASVRAELAG